MTTLSTVRFGFIGAGAIAHYAADAVRKHSNASLVAIQDPHLERRSTFQSKHALEHAHESVEELLANKAVDAVYIAVPNKFHIPLAIQALSKPMGKHVILEMPFAMNAIEAEQAINLAKKFGPRPLCGHEPALQRRFAEDQETR